MRVLKTCVAVVVACAALTAAAAPSDAATASAIVVRVTSVDFLPPTEDCLFRAASPLTPIRGSAGALEVCFETFELGCDGRCQFGTGTATWTFPEGRIFTRFRVAEFFVDEATVVAFWTGTITGGTGAYAGATGHLRGDGRIVFGPEGPQPDLRFVLAVR